MARASRQIRCGDNAGNRAGAPRDATWLHSAFPSTRPKARENPLDFEPAIRTGPVWCCMIINDRL